MLLRVAVVVVVIVIEAQFVTILRSLGSDLEIARDGKRIADRHRSDPDWGTLHRAILHSHGAKPDLTSGQPTVGDCHLIVQGTHVQPIDDPANLGALLGVAVGVVVGVRDPEPGTLGRAGGNEGDIGGHRWSVAATGLAQSPRPMAPCVTRVLAVAVGVKHGDGEINVAGSCGRRDPVCGPRAGEIAAVSQLAVRELYVGAEIRPASRAHVKVESSLPGGMGAAVPT